jgi:Polyketide cyclase / dehydrase and lipid transport
MVKITDSTIIDRPVEEVWSFVSDPGNDPKWYQGTMEVRQISERPIAVGTTFEAVIQFRGRFLVAGARCIVLNPNNEVMWKFTSGLMKRSTDNWRMEPMDEKSTRLTRVFVMRVSGFWRLIQPIVARGTKRAHEAEIHNVKRILEGESQL